MKKTTAVKITVWTVILAAAAVGIWLMVRPSGSGDITLQTAPVTRGDIRNSVTATGTVEPVTLVEVGTQVSGIIDRLYVDYNDRVTAGQLIAEMDKVTLESDLEEAEAQLASSKTEYEYRMKEYLRTKKLYDKELVSDAEYDEALYGPLSLRDSQEHLCPAPGLHRRHPAQPGLRHHHLSHRRSGHQPGGGGGPDSGRRLRDTEWTRPT